MGWMTLLDPFHGVGEASTTYLAPNPQPVCQVRSVGQRGRKSHQANSALCLGADVAHAGYNHLQDGSPAHDRHTGIKKVSGPPLLGNVLSTGQSCFVAWRPSWTCGTL